MPCIGTKRHKKLLSSLLRMVEEEEEEEEEDEQMSWTRWQLSCHAVSSATFLSPCSCQVRVAAALAVSLVRREAELWVRTVQVLLEQLMREMVGEEEGEREGVLIQCLTMSVRV